MMQTGPQGEMSRFMEHVQNLKGSPRPDRHGAVVLLWIALSALGGCSDRAETEHHTSGTSEASERSSAPAPQSPKPTKTEAAEAEPSADAPAATATPTAIEVPSPPSQNARQFRRRYRRPYTDADGRIALGLILDASFADGEMVPGFLLNDLDTIEPTNSPVDVPPGPVSGDFDGDGTLDAAPGPMLSTVIADFNGDGCDDLLGPMLFTSTEPPTLRMGSPTGLGEALPWNGPQLQSPAVGDFDDDGLEDLVGFAGGDAPTRTLSIFFGTAEGLPTRPDVVRTYRTERPFPMVWSLYAPGRDRILVSPRYLDVKLLNLLEEGDATRIEEFPPSTSTTTAQTNCFALVTATTKSIDSKATLPAEHVCRCSCRDRNSAMPSCSIAAPNTPPLSQSSTSRTIAFLCLMLCRFPTPHFGPQHSFVFGGASHACRHKKRNERSNSISPTSPRPRRPQTKPIPRPTNDPKFRAKGRHRTSTQGSKLALQSRNHAPRLALLNADEAHRLFSPEGLRTQGAR